MSKLKTLENIKPESIYNSDGYRKDIEYPRDEKGDILWKDLIDPKYIVPNGKFFKRKNLPIPDSIESLKDNQKLVVLAGYRKLAQVRGFKKVIYTPIGFDKDEVSLSCEITWKGNKETDYDDVVWASTANASVKNVECNDYADFTTFLTPIAENRAFVRAVRTFLNIPILGQDEIGPDKDKREESADDIKPNSPQWVLRKALDEKNKSFDQFKTFLLKKIDKLGITSEEVMSFKGYGDLTSSISIKALQLLK